MRAAALSLDLINTIKYSPDSCVLLSVEGQILAVSDAFHQISGTKVGIVGSNLFDVFPDNPDAQDINSVFSLKDSISTAVKEKKTKHLPLQRYDIPKDGNPNNGFIEKFWRASNTPILSEQGEVMFILHKTEDVTQQINDKKQINVLTVQTENLLLQEQAARRETELQRVYLYELLMQTPVAIAIFQGSDHIIELANERILKIWGRSREQVLGKPLLEALPEIAGQGYEDILTRVLRKGETYESSNVSVPIDQGKGVEQFYFHIVYHPFRDINGQISGVIATTIELTGQVKATKQLEQTMQDLQERNFELDQFVYKTSHDLRAPLMTILGLVSLIKQETLPDAVGQYMDLIQSRVHKLDGFIKSTLDYSRSTRTDVEREKIDLQGLVKETFAALELMKNFDRLHITVDIADSDFYSDVFRLRIIFSNLISNAVKYMDTGKEENFLEIKIKVNQARAKIHLIDNGMGIDTSCQARIFGMFVRATEQSDGSGLGLYIVRQAVLALKGTITFRSMPGKGTHFLISLPNKNTP